MFDLGFLPVRIWDILDILIVGYLIYQIYKLLRGSIAFNIFIGVVILYLIWWLVGVLKMDLLLLLLNQFVSVGVIILIIIFQPEVRRFLLLVGNTTLRQRSNFLRRWLDRNFEGEEIQKDIIRSVKNAIVRMSRRKVGALIVMTKNLDLSVIKESGVALDATISQPLLESIFNKESPLHDGAVLLSNSKIQAASCILPVSDNQALPQNAGLRHRAAVGVTERLNVASFVVSEETGRISFAFEGKLQRDITPERLESLLQRHWQ